MSFARGEYRAYMALRLAPLTATAALLLAATPARAWQEAHQIGDDAAVHIGSAGVADVEQHIKWHVVRGPLKGIDLVNVDPSATVDPDVLIHGDDGRSLTGHAIRRDDRSVRVSVDEPRVVMRGGFTFTVRWHEDLVAAHVLSHEGGSWRLSWSAPVAADGFDGARTVFALPAAPDPPVAIVADTGAVDDAAVATLRRDPGTDVLELVRPHVGRGEAPVWTVRVDPRALGVAASPAPRSLGSATSSAEPDRVRAVTGGALLGALALAFGLLVHRKARAFATACESRGAKARGLLQMPEGLRAMVAGAALASAVGLEAAGFTTAGACAAALAALAATLRTPRSRAAARGPGRWLLLSTEDAFHSAAARSLPGTLVPLAGLAALVLVAFVARRIDSTAPWLVAIDAVALVPLVSTGRASQLPPDGASSAAPWLEGAWRRLQRVASVRVRPWARVPLEGASPDELRLLVLPRASMPGLIGVELGLAWSHTPVGWTPAPEVLARVLDGSAASARLVRELPQASRVPGRRPEERVLRLCPRTPTRRAAVELVKAVAEALTDRRAEAVAWAGQERRGVGSAPVIATA